MLLKTKAFPTSAVVESIEITGHFRLYAAKLGRRVLMRVGE